MDVLLLSNVSRPTWWPDQVDRVAVVDCVTWQEGSWEEVEVEVETPIRRSATSRKYLWLKGRNHEGAQSRFFPVSLGVRVQVRTTIQCDRGLGLNKCEHGILLEAGQEIQLS